MRRTLIALAVTLVAAIAPLQAQSHHDEHAASHHDEDAAVRSALDHYLQGQATGDGSHYKLVFHPEAKLFWVRDGEFNTRTSEEFIANASRGPAEDEADRERWIESVDIAGNAAVAKIVLDYPDVKFTDYMSMLKIDGQWMIVNKTFTAEMKAASR